MDIVIGPSLSGIAQTEQTSDKKARVQRHFHPFNEEKSGLLSYFIACLCSVRLALELRMQADQPSN